MGDIVARLVKASTADVEADGLVWHVKRVHSIDLHRAGLAYLRMFPKEVRDAAVDKRVKGEEMSAADVALSLKEEDMRRWGTYQEGIVCAGIVGVTDEEGVRHDIRVVMKPDQVNHEQKVMHITDLPGGTVETLFKAIEKLEKKEGGDIAASFREDDGAREKDEAIG